MFEKFIEFLKNYVLTNYIYIIGVIMVIVLIIIFLLMGKKLSLKHVLDLVSLIPSFVAAAESVFPSGNGSKKKLLVKDMVEQAAISLGTTKYLKYINLDLIIEDVLKAPQKKGVVTDAKTNEAQ